MNREAAIAVILKENPDWTPERAGVAYDAVLAEKAVEEAEKAEGNHLGTIEPDATPDGADWIRRVRGATAPVEE